MAEDVSIAGTQARAKIRNLWAVAILPIVTLGIYFFFWWYFIHRELRDYGRARNTDELGTSPGTSVLAVTLGALIVVPALVSMWRGFQRVQAAQRMEGNEQISGWVGLILFFVFVPVLYAYMQSGLNTVWEKHRSAAA